MKIALIGYGKMGKAIEEIAIQRGHEIVAKIDFSNDVSDLKSLTADVAIEFTRPDAVVQNISYCSEIQLPIVVGTTAWYHEFEKVKRIITENNATLLYASNFSIGVNVLFEINRILAKLMSNQKEYTTSIEEIHHLQKLDAPSGTALSIANDILKENDVLTKWKLGEEHSPSVDENELAITSYRQPDVPGTHIVQYKSEVDCIEIKHEAFNRKGFALGAVLAAEFVKGKKGIFTMSDVLNINESIKSK